MKKAAAAGLSLLLILSLAACGGSNGAGGKSASIPSAEAEQAVTVRAAALKGPTAMGLVKLMRDSEDGNSTYGYYDFTLAASADEVSPGLIQGELDVACVPANLASVLYEKSKGEIVALSINTLGVLYIVEQGDSVTSLSDLKGKTIAAAGKGSTPEYALRYLLRENGVDPDTDVTIDWKSEHSECVSALASGSEAIALLPQPFVTVAQGKIEGLRVALDLTEQWDRLENGSALITGVTVGRRQFAEEHPVATALFLEGYGASVVWVNEQTEDSARLIGSYGIVDTAVAEQALPQCNIVCITGAEMKEKLSGYLEVLYDQDPASVGGALPEDDFYYGA